MKSGVLCMILAGLVWVSGCAGTKVIEAQFLI